jgi:hypothetical protein
MTALDQLVVGVGLHSIRIDLGGSIENLEWIVDAYALAFVVLFVLFVLAGGAALALLTPGRPRTPAEAAAEATPISPAELAPETATPGALVATNDDLGAVR